jgi:hypothetical protein
LVVLLVIAILTGVRWNLRFDLHSLSGQKWYFFMCFLAIWISSFEKIQFSSVANFFIGSLLLEFSF